MQKQVILKKYKTIRNICSNFFRIAQHQHIYNSIKNGDSAKIWKFLKTSYITNTKFKSKYNL